MKELKISIVIILILFAAFFLVDNYVKKDITIIDDQKVIKIRTFESDLSQLLSKYNFDLTEYDKLSVPKNTSLKDNMLIEIDRAFKVDIIDNDSVDTIFTTEVLVKSILKKNNIVLSPLDKVYPSETSYIKEGDSIKVTRIVEKEITEDIEVPFQTIIKLIPDLKPGEIKIESVGQVGKKRVNYKATYKDGVEISKEVTEEEYLTEVVNEVILKGLDKLFVTSRGVPFRYKEVIIMEATAYDLSYQSTGKYPSHPQYGITYSGTQAHPGVVAVDKNVINLGSKLYVESLDSTRDYGFASAEDTGSAIKGTRIDLFISDHDRAMAYGRRKVRVYVLDEKISDDELKGYSERRIYGSN